MSDKAKTALREMLERNRLRNDFDAYLYALAEWGLGIIDERPVPEEFSQPPLKVNTTCRIFGSDIGFEKVVPVEEVEAVCQDIWDNVDKYSDYQKTGEFAYYKFLKFLWVEYPNGTTKRLTDIVDM